MLIRHVTDVLYALAPTHVAAERDGDEGEEDVEEDDAGEEEFEDGGGEGEVGGWRCSRGITVTIRAKK